MGTLGPSCICSRVRFLLRLVLAEIVGRTCRVTLFDFLTCPMASVDRLQSRTFHAYGGATSDDGRGDHAASYG